MSALQTTSLVEATVEERFIIIMVRLILDQCFGEQKHEIREILIIHLWH